QLSEALSAAQVAEITADHAMAALGASAAWVTLVGADGTNVRLACAPGFPDDVQQHVARSSIEEPSPVAAAARLDAPLWLASKEEVVDAYPELGLVLGGMGSLALLPLSAGERMLGGIGLCRRRAGG